MSEWMNWEATALWLSLTDTQEETAHRRRGDTIFYRDPHWWGAPTMLTLRPHSLSQLHIKAGKEICLGHFDHFIWFTQRAGMEFQPCWLHLLALHTRTHTQGVHTHTGTPALSYGSPSIRSSTKSSKLKMTVLSFSEESTSPWNPKEQRGCWEKGDSKNNVFTGNTCLVQEPAKKCWKHRDFLTSLFFHSVISPPH